jgi:hypothetical protein
MHRLIVASLSGGVGLASAADLRRPAPAYTKAPKAPFYRNRKD